MRMTRRTAMSAIGAMAAGPVLARAPLAYDLKPASVAPGIWMIEGSRNYFSMENGGAIVNIVMLETDAGLVIIDTGPSLRYGEALRQVALQMTGRGIAGVILTHHHPDHFFGNLAFADVEIRALAETGKYARSHGEGYSDAMYRILGDWMRGTEVTPPNKVLAGGDFAIGGRALRALPLGGHTEADLAIVDVETGLVIAGDLAFLDRAATTPDADLPRWRQSLDTLEGLRASAIVPGHGPLDRTGDSLRQTRAYLDWLEATLRDGAETGLDMVEIMEKPLPEEFATLGAQPQEFQRSVSHLFPDIEAEVLPLLNR
ncbi:MAG: quinoprotein relay system zinc metallohydrolase 1 [Pseudomonadota bacterium]